MTSAVRFEVTPYLMFSPACGSVSWLTNPPVEVSSDPNWIAVKVGKNSKLRLVDKLVIPCINPI